MLRNVQYFHGFYTEQFQSLVGEVHDEAMLGDDAD
jgi:hypothetical protein